MGSESEPREDEVSAVKADTEGNTRRATARRAKGQLTTYHLQLITYNYFLLTILPANSATSPTPTARKQA